jgi:putative ABC transport system ATP-binding protein
LASFPVLYGTLELPKRIINRAIAGTGFPKTVAGFELDRTYLLVLCVTFLACRQMKR